MKILAFASNQSSPAYHRIILPLGLIRQHDVYVTNNLLDEQFKDAQVFMYNRILPEPHISHIYDLRKKYGFKIVVDVDDYWELDEHHILYNLYQKEKFAVKQVEQLSAADIVFTTHSRLADEVRVYNDNVHVLPNAIPKFGQYIKYKPKPFPRCRIFWQGSDTHLEDLRLLTFVFKSLPVDSTFKMVMAGYNPNNPVLREMSLIYTDGGRLPNSVVDQMHFNNYYQAYEEADVCLVPLINSRFNSMKSNLKVLEAANLGLPCIVHNVHPYKDMPVIYARSTRDWVTWIKKFAASAKRRKEYGSALKDWCFENYNFDKINYERKNILEHETGKH